jgi:hypothetical protein
MITLLMSFALVAVVAAAGLYFSSKMDELTSHPDEQPPHRTQA